MTVDNLAYLSSHQAIADIAQFISEFLIPTYNLTENNPIITFGGSYPGALSAWIRLRIPQLVFAAFSTSSPVLAQLDFTGYCDVVAASMSNSLVGGSPQCLTALESAFQSINTALRGSPSEQAAMAKLMSSCEPPQSIQDLETLTSNLAGVVMGTVQYNDEGFYPLDVQSMCNMLTNTSTNPLNAFAQIVQVANGGQCMDNSYADYISQLGNVAFAPGASGVGMRQWVYQTCTEFGYYQTCENGTSCPFSTLMDLGINFEVCADAYDTRLTEQLNAARVDFTNDYMGGQDIGSSRILFTNGLIDPWHALSVLPGNNQNPANQALVIPDGAHCRQMLPSEPTDPPDVKAARLAAAAILAGWLNSTTTA